MPCDIYDSESNIFIDLIIFYLFCIVLNEANTCFHASGEVGLTMIEIFCGFCLNARFLHKIKQVDASGAVTRHHVLLLPCA